MITFPLVRRVCATSRDLPFDGCPTEFTARSALDGCQLQTYHWRKRNFGALRGIVFVLHGVRAHSRLTWLAKRPPVFNHLPTPITLVEEIAATGDAQDPANWAAKIAEVGEAMQDPCHRLLRSASENDNSKADSSPHSRKRSDNCSTFSGTAWEPTSPKQGLQWVDATEKDKETHLFYQGSWIEALNVLGFEVLAMDLRGHGKSAGARCVVNNFHDYCVDVKTVIEQVVWGRFAPKEEDDRRPPAEWPKLYVVGVSLSTLIVCNVLQQEWAASLRIHACALISGFLREGEKFMRRPMATLLNVLMRARHVVPSLPIILPKKPETQGPPWQIRFGKVDPYLYRSPFRVKMVGNCLAALRDFEDTKALLIKQGGCRRLKMFHNYLDCVNPIDGSMQPMTWLMGNKGEMDIQCIVFNAHQMRPEHENLWHTAVELDTTPVDLEHTLVTDKHNIYVFAHFMKWLLDES